ncbi:MAG: hypothetical protein A2Z25_20705 [Planctomycetes bacterium RBG_16_55_9]|nr:MAG: hypothetical protein A2Z25_20705 [Planctomycetes bacterium RBG_16_55_9]
MKKLLTLGVIAFVLLFAAQPAPAVCIYFTGNEYVCDNESDTLTGVADKARRYNTDTKRHLLKVSGVWQPISDIGDQTIKNKYLAYLLSTGLIWGGQLSINADTTKFDLSAGGGLKVDSHTDPQNPTITVVEWATQTGVTDLYRTTCDETQIHIDGSGDIVQVGGDVYIDDPDRKDYIHIGGVGHPDHTEITYVLNEPVYLPNAFLQLYDFLYSFGAFNITGNEYSPNGATLQINRSAGKVFDVGANISYSTKSPNILVSTSVTATEFYYSWTDGSGEWQYSDPPATSIDPEYYDTLTGLAAVPAGKWTIQTITFYANGDFTDIQYGQTYYDSLAAAESAINLGYVLDPYLAYDVFRCWLIVKQGTTALNDPAYAKFINKKGFAGAGGGGGGAGGGEVNTASNVGTAGVGFFDAKVAVDLQLKNAEAASNKISITDYPANKTVRFDVNEANLTTNANKIQGKDFPALGVGDDEKYPKYDHDTGAFIMSTVTGGSGDSISVNGTAAADADLDDATPAAPANSINVKWQKDALTPNNVSAYTPYAAPLTVATGNLTVVDASTTAKGAVELATDGESAGGLATQSNDGRLSNARTPTNHDDAYHTTSYSGVGTCTNQFPRTLNDSASPTCASVADADISGTIAGTKTLAAGAFADSTAYQLGKATPTAVTLNVGHNGTSALVNTLNIAAHTHSSTAGAGGQVAVADTTGTLAVGRGGSGLTTVAADQIYLGTAADTFTAKSIPDCDGATTAKLLYDTTTHAFSCGTDQTSAGGGGKAMFHLVSSAALAADAYCALSGYDVCSTSSTASRNQTRVPFSGTLKNLYAWFDAAQASGDSCTFTVRTGTCRSTLTNTSITCNISTSPYFECSDTTNTASVTAGQCVQIFFDEISGTCSGFALAVVEIDPS